MPEIQAIILAAGRGSRLGGTSYEQPKCLLEIGRRRLIEHQLDALSEAGVGPVHMVLGYGADEVREIVGMRAEYVMNTRWSATNSLYSFLQARDVVEGDVLVLNCDVLFSSAMVDKLLDQPGDAIAIDSSSGQGREQMKVRTVDGRLIQMAKNLPADEVTGENVGMLKFTAKTAQTVFDTAERLVAAGGEKQWLGAAIAEIAPQCEIRTVDIAGLPWIEIDFPTDLARARSEVWPAIEGHATRRRRLWLSSAALTGFVLMLVALFVGTQISRPAPLPPVDWETVEMEPMQSVRVNIGERAQTWWLMDGGRPAAVTVTGPGPARIETRLLDEISEREPYVIEVTLDGERVDWFKLNTRPSGKATHPQWTVARKKRVTIDVPEGTHTLQVRLVAPAGASCLVRTRQIESDDQQD